MDLDYQPFLFVAFCTYSKRILLTIFLFISSFFQETHQAWSVLGEIKRRAIREPSGKKVLTIRSSSAGNPSIWDRCCSVSSVIQGSLRCLNTVDNKLDFNFFSTTVLKRSESIMVLRCCRWPCCHLRDSPCLDGWWWWGHDVRGLLGRRHSCSRELCRWKLWHRRYKLRSNHTITPRLHSC